MVGRLLSKVSSAVAACARRMSRVTSRILRPRSSSSRRDRRQLVPADDHHYQEGPPCADEVEAAEEAENALWRRAILMGERCKLLDFPGVIHYDSFGRRLSVPPLHWGGHTVLLCRSMYDVDEAAVAAPRKVVAKCA